VVEDEELRLWFCDEVLPLEKGLMGYIRANWRSPHDVVDLRQEIYERAITGARSALPVHTRAYIYTVARNHLINRARRAKIVSIEAIADLESVMVPDALAGSERHLSARDELRRAEAGLNQLPPRCRQVIWLRKVEGMSTREAAQHLGISTHTVEKHLTEGLRALANFMLDYSQVRSAPKVLRWKARRR